MLACMARFKEKLTVGQNAAAQGPHRLSAVQREQAELLLQVGLELLAVRFAKFGIASVMYIGQSPLPAILGGALVHESILPSITFDSVVRVFQFRKVDVNVESLARGTRNWYLTALDMEDELLPDIHLGDARGAIGGRAGLAVG